MSRHDSKSHKGRGAASNPDGRFEPFRREAFDDGWTGEEQELPPLETTVEPESARVIISRNDSPDVPFTQSINPYRGCEHGCIYCYARPTHSYLGLSPGLDFETRLFAKSNGANLLRKELARPGYRCSVISLGANTDPYQPIERRWRITRQILEVLDQCNHPVGIVTKSSLVERDIELLAGMARRNLVHVYVSLASLNGELARHLEPRAASPSRRLQTIGALAGAGIPVGVILGPVIPVLNDQDLEKVLDRAWEAGARMAGYVLVRLPHEVKDLFREWLRLHYPLTADHVMSVIRQMRDGRDNDPHFGSRMRGKGIFAELLAQRFQVACKRLGYNQGPRELDTRQFRPPEQGGQMELF